MELRNFPVGTVDWRTVDVTREAGQYGHADIRTVQRGTIKLRLVDYSPGYTADHWCNKGHIVLVLNGSMTLEHKGGPHFMVATGMSYCVGDDEIQPHRVHSEKGCRAFVVD